MVVAVKELNIIICGVGGQGIVLMSELLGRAAVEEGLKIMGSEVLGMAQRGGPVFSNIRIGNEVHAPLTADGKCDIMVAIEPSEALRNINFLSRTSLVILNTRKVVPYTVYIGESKYPALDEIRAKLADITGKVIVFDAAKTAEEAGSLQSVNIVMLGAAFGTGKIPIKIEALTTAIRVRFNPKLAAINIKAFASGYDMARTLLLPSQG